MTKIIGSNKIIKKIVTQRLNKIIIIPATSKGTNGTPKNIAGLVHPLNKGSIISTRPTSSH